MARSRPKKPENVRRSFFSGIPPRFRPRRHLLTAAGYRDRMTDRFTTWNEMAGLPAAA